MDFDFLLRETGFVALGRGFGWVEFVTPTKVSSLLGQRVKKTCLLDEASLCFSQPVYRQRFLLRPAIF